MIKCQNLTAVRNNNVIFKNLTLNIPEGKLLVIKGKNGTGKTTLLRLLIGLLTPHKGYILYHNIDIQQNFSEYVTNLHFISHDFPIKLEATVADNILHWAILHKTPMLLDAALTYFNLYSVANTECNKLSAGYLKRVALSTLCACPTKIWLLDEPFTNLDTDTTEKLVHLINTRTTQDGIVCLTTHTNIKLANTTLVNIEDYK